MPKTLISITHGTRMPNERAFRNHADRIAAFRAFCPVAREWGLPTCAGCPLEEIEGLDNVEDCALAWLELPSHRKCDTQETLARKTKANARTGRERRKSEEEG